GSEPQDVAITPDGRRAYITNTTSNNVSVIDTTTNTVVATIPVGSDPWKLAINPNGRRAYVTTAATNNVQVINTTTNTVVATVPVGAFPDAVAITPGNGKHHKPEKPKKPGHH
ncbi:YncE family protein, partial [Streptomyces sp. NPDC004230]